MGNMNLYEQIKGYFNSIQSTEGVNNRDQVKEHERAEQAKNLWEYKNSILYPLDRLIDFYLSNKSYLSSRKNEINEELCTLMHKHYGSEKTDLYNYTSISTEGGYLGVVQYTVSFADEAEVFYEVTRTPHNKYGLACVTIPCSSTYNNRITVFDVSTDETGYGTLMSDVFNREYNDYYRTLLFYTYVAMKRVQCRKTEDINNCIEAQKAKWAVPRKGGSNNGF
jgi:hypothetical protein